MPLAAPSRSALVRPPISAHYRIPGARIRSARPAVMFVNFDGATLNDDREDSRTNSTLIGFSGVFEPYGVGAKRTAILQAVREDWQPFAMTITDTRPAEGDYTMAMVGPTNFTAGSLGVALLDCDNAWTPNNIVYAFHHSNDGYSATETATTIGQEVAHSFGLEHVDSPSDVMHPFNSGGDPRFSDVCEPVVEAPGIGILCRAQHERSCGAPDRQNAHLELLDQLGPRPVDLMPPTVAFVDPPSGTRFADDEPFILEVSARDDDSVVTVELLHDGVRVASDNAPPFSWEVSGALPGKYRFVAVARDAAGNESRSSEHTLYVDGVGGPGEGGTDSSGAWGPEFGSTGDDGLYDDGSEGAGVAANGVPDGEDPFDPLAGGCDCRTTGPSSRGLGLLAWMLAAASLGRTRRLSLGSRP